MHLGPSEAEPFWTAFLRELVRRGLRGVKLVISLSLQADHDTASQTWRQVADPLRLR